MPVDIHIARQHWFAVVSAAEMVQASIKVRDSLLLLGPSPSAARAEAILREATGLLAELGQGLTQLRHSEDPEVAGFVQLLLDRLHGSPDPAAAAEAAREGG